MRTVHSKNGKIELMRFVAALFILNGHLGFMHGVDIERPFSLAWFYVEFFLILSGYFTTLSMRRTAGNDAEISVKYTISKFSRFIPYVAIPVPLYYVLSYVDTIRLNNTEFSFVEFVKYCERIPTEIAFLSAADISGTMLFTMWYLSAMFICFPVYCLLVRIKNKYIIMMISVYCSVFYYLSRYDFGSHDYPNQIIRTFCGLMLGTVVYLFSEILKDNEKRFCGKTWSILFSITEVVAITVPIVIAFFNVTLLRIDLLCFIVSLCVIFSGMSRVPNFSNSVFTFLGKLSLPIYIWHLVAAQIVNVFFYDKPVLGKVALMYAITVLVSIINIIIVEAFLNRKKLR